MAGATQHHRMMVIMRHADLVTIVVRIGAVTVHVDHKMDGFEHQDLSKRIKDILVTRNIRNDLILHPINQQIQAISSVVSEL